MLRLSHVVSGSKFISGIFFLRRHEEVFKKYNMPHKPVRVFTYLIGREISDLKAANWMACKNRGKPIGHQSQSLFVRGSLKVDSNREKIDICKVHLDLFSN